eukprot:203254-Amphidinium_carterae.1
MLSCGAINDDGFWGGGLSGGDDTLHCAWVGDSQVAVIGKACADCCETYPTPLLDARSTRSRTLLIVMRIASQTKLLEFVLIGPYVGGWQNQLRILGA